MLPFQKFDKIPRLSRDIVITEKIDGTNGQIYNCGLIEISNSFAGDYQNQESYTLAFIEKYCLYRDFENGLYMFAGSRTRWLDCSGSGDNYGFAKWVKANAEELMKLGEGRHYGEWWGKGIQRNYGLDEKRFSLFNVGRWIKLEEGEGLKEDSKLKECPKCCSVVPILYEGIFDTNKIDEVLKDLEINGSKASLKFFKNAEGIIIYHIASGRLFKKTIKNDEKPKGNNENSN